MIDTLILPGCSSKGIAYIGILYVLEKNNIIQKKNIKNILACSAGSIFGFMYLINFTIPMMYKIMKNINLINLNLFTENEIFQNNGIINNYNIFHTLKICLKHKYNKNNITFLELYKLTKINFKIKVFNLSKNKEEYFSYKNNPNMSVLTAVRISTCIPFIFSPIKYNDMYYLDGGIRNSIPFIDKKKYKNHFIIQINNFIKKNIDYYNLNIDDYIVNVLNICMNSKVKTTKKCMNIYLDLPIYEVNSFNITKITENTIKQTNKYLEKYHQL